MGATTEEGAPEDGLVDYARPKRDLGDLYCVVQGSR